MLKAAGGCIVAKDTKRILLQQRSSKSSYPRHWGFWGGKVEPNENVSQALLRELREELELDIERKVEKIYPLDQYHSRDKTFSYYTFIIVVDTEFLPKLNTESGGYAWIDSEHFPKPMHPGTRDTLFKKKKLKQIKSIILSL
ncbi:NUDIX hydrolase [bacterium]|nr:NUDIX hydrolase [bacterium]